MTLSVMTLTVGRGVEEEEVLQWHVLVWVSAVLP